MVVYLLVYFSRVLSYMKITNENVQYNRFTIRVKRMACMWTWAALSCLASHHSLGCHHEQAFTVV
jgi:hypothetical protein